MLQTNALPTMCSSMLPKIAGNAYSAVKDFAARSPILCPGLILFT